MSLNTHNYTEVQEGLNSGSQLDTVQRQLQQAPELGKFNVSTPEGRNAASGAIHRNSVTMIAELPQGTEIPNDIARAQVEQTLARVQSTLLQMDRAIDRLSDAGRTHQIQEIQDGIPVWREIRSHRIAKQESELLAQLNRDIDYLDALLSKSAVSQNIDVKNLRDKVSEIKRSDGFLRVLGSIFPSVRSTHRDLTHYQLDDVRSAIDSLSRHVDAMKSIRSMPA